jgi:hypothetical protein
LDWEGESPSFFVIWKCPGNPLTLQYKINEMAAKLSIYQRAKKFGCRSVGTCVSNSSVQCDIYMKGARPANKKKVIRIALLAGIIDAEQAKQELKNPNYNPYTHYVTRKHIIYVWSAQEHFIEVD